MSKLSARQLDAGLERPRLAAVDWSVPSTEPDTSEVDESWFEEQAPRHSFIALTGTFERHVASRSSEAATPGAQLAYDVWESAHALVVLIDLPGVSAEHVALSLGSQALHLDVSASEADESWRGVPSGHHEVPLDAQLAVGPDAIDASLRNGLLRIRIAKESGARRVAIVTSPEHD